MIVAKPKINTLFSLSLFLVIVYSIVGYLILNFKGAVYQYILMGIFSLIGLIVTLKLLLGFKILRVGQGKINVYFPFRFKRFERSLDQITNWEQIIIETKSTPFKELQIHFEDGKKIGISLQEYEAYEKVHKYLKQKAAKKELKK